MTFLIIIALILAGLAALLRSVSPTLAGLSLGAIVIGGGVALFDASLGWLIVKGGMFCAVVLLGIGIIGFMRD